MGVVQISVGHPVYVHCVEWNDNNDDITMIMMTMTAIGTG